MTVRTGPSRQVLDMIRGLAEDALELDGEFGAQIALMLELHDKLCDLGYAPPTEEWFEIHFLHLLSLIDGQRITEESGTRIGEEGKDWDGDIREVSIKLAGRPL